MRRDRDDEKLMETHTVSRTVSSFLCPIIHHRFLFPFGVSIMSRRLLYPVRVQSFTFQEMENADC
jgi:hypothetical protein